MEGCWQRTAADGVTILACGVWERVWGAMGAGTGWLFREQIRRDVISGRCAGGCVRGFGDTGGAPLELRWGSSMRQRGEAPLER